MAESTVLNFISFVPWTFIIMILNAYILYRIVRHFLFKPVKEIFRKRQEEVGEIYESATNLQKEAEKRKLRYDKKLDAASLEATEILKNADIHAKETLEKKLLLAQQEANQIIDNAKTEAKQMKFDVNQTLKKDVADLSIEIAKKITEKELSQEVHLDLIEQSIKQIQGEVR